MQILELNVEKSYFWKFIVRLLKWSGVSVYTRKFVYNHLLILIKNI